MPLLLIISTSRIESCVMNDISMPYARAMKRIANDWYIIEPSRLKA